MKAYLISADINAGLPISLKAVPKVVWTEGEIDQETIDHHLHMMLKARCEQAGISTRNTTISASISYLGDA